MIRSVTIRAQALADFEEVSAWYEARSPGRGSDFIGECLERVRYIGRFAEMYPIDDDGVRKAPLSHFPYDLYYAVEGEEVVILRVIHARRSRDSWELREPAVRWIHQCPPGVLSEPNHWEAVLEARQRFVDDPGQGEDMEDVMARLRSRRYGN